METHIRPASAGDLDSLVALLGLLFGIETDFDADAARQRQGLQLLLQEKKACVLVAESAGRVVGMCSGQVVISTALGGPSMLVEDVVLLEEWRGRGIGRRLLAALEKWAEKRGVFRMQLLADRDNEAALSFYTALGWRGTRMLCLSKMLAR